MQLCCTDLSLLECLRCRWVPLVTHLINMHLCRPKKSPRQWQYGYWWAKLKIIHPYLICLSLLSSPSSLFHAPCRLLLTPCLSKASRMGLWLQNSASPLSITWTSSCFLPWWHPSPRYQSSHTPCKSSCLVTITNTFSYTFLKHLIIHSSLDTHGSANITPKLTGKIMPSWDSVCLVTSFVSSLLFLLRPRQKTTRAAWPFCGAFAYHILQRYSTKTISSPHQLYNYAIDFFPRNTTSNK